MKYNSCPRCGTKKRDIAKLCRNCWKESERKKVTVAIGIPNPSGMCMCGCGQPAPISVRTSKQGMTIEGLAVRYIDGHKGMKSHAEYIENPETGCWVWQRAKSGAGYGHLTVDGKYTLAHRLYYERHKGPIPKGKIIDHLCRNRGCVNPDHLEVVSHKENCRRGAGSKITQEDVDEIRRLAATETQTSIAAKFGISQSHVHRIIHKTEWN